MYNLIQIQDAIKGLPIQDVMKYARGVNPDVPAYLALAELNRRKQIQDTATSFYGEPQTVREQIESSLTGAPQGQVNPTAAPQMINPAATPPQLQTLTAPPPKPQMPAMPMVPPQMNPTQAPSVPQMRKGGLASLPIGMFKRSNYAGGGIVAFTEGSKNMTVEEAARKQQEEERAKQIESQRAELGILPRFLGSYASQALETPTRGFNRLARLEAEKRQKQMSEQDVQEGYESAPEKQVPTNQQASATTSGQIPEKREPAKPLFGQRVTVTQPPIRELTDEEFLERRRKLEDLAGVSRDPYADVKRRYADIEAKRAEQEKDDPYRSLMASLAAFGAADPAKGYAYAGAKGVEAMQSFDKETAALRDKQASTMAELQMNMAKEEDARRRGDVTAVETHRAAQQKNKLDMAKLEIDLTNAQAHMAQATRPSQIMELANLYKTNPELAAKVQGISKTGGLSADDIVKILSTDPTFMSMTPEQKIATVRAAMGGAGTAAPPAVGTVKDGYRFKGGDPANKNNWEKV